MKDPSGSRERPSKWDSELAMRLARVERLLLALADDKVQAHNVMMDGPVPTTFSTDIVELRADIQERSACARCGESFQPPIGLFGTNDCACPHCEKCYTATDTDWNGA